ncbi:MAG: sporulation protein YabP [Clostridia bacterium]|nr:sporulation protein YabP [Clostridia bacterium]
MNEQARPHDIIIRSRAHMDINGVKSVISFDEECVCLDTVMGELMIEGEELNVSSLDTDRGTVQLSGKINGLYYNTQTSEPKKGFFGRLLG